jgi:hypothetical protein
VIQPALPYLPSSVGIFAVSRGEGRCAVMQYCLGGDGGGARQCVCQL